MALSSLQSVLVAAFLLLLMFGMGATLSRERFARVLADPKPLAVGLVSQFLWMPFAAFVIARFLGLPDAVAIGLIIVGVLISTGSLNLTEIVRAQDGNYGFLGTTRPLNNGVEDIEDPIVLSFVRADIGIVPLAKPRTPNAANATRKGGR